MNLKGWNLWALAGGVVVLALAPVAAVQAGRYWASQVALMSALGFLMIGLSRRS